MWLLLRSRGAIFSVGVTALPKYFSKDKVGLANGIYGMGNIGTAISSFAPVLAGLIGWQSSKKLLNYYRFICSINVLIGR